MKSMNVWDFQVHQKNIHLQKETVSFWKSTFWSAPQSSPWSGNGSSASLALPPTSNTGGGCHILHIWSSTRLFPCLPVLSSDTADLGWGSIIIPILIRRGRGCSTIGFHMWKSALAVRGSPRPFPGKEAGTGASTQAPFWPNVYCPFTTCHFWFRNCLWLVFQH